MRPAKAAPATVALLAEPVNGGAVGALVGAGFVELPGAEGLEVGMVPLG